MKDTFMLHVFREGLTLKSSPYLASRIGPNLFWVPGVHGLCPSLFMQHLTDIFSLFSEEQTKSYFLLDRTESAIEGLYFLKAIA